MGSNVRLLLMAAVALMFVPCLHAQNAVVLGSVVSSTDAAMPGVTVQLANNSTGFLRSVTTALDGSYVINEVPPADGYKITAIRADGSTIQSKEGISVSVGDERSILPALKEGPAGATGTEPVPAATVQSAVPNEKSNTSIGSVITGDQLRSLPLYNRNFLVLGLLSPNTHDVEAGSILVGASFSIAGQRPSSNNFLLDGADNVASSTNQAIPFQVNDAIKEFRVTSSTANAEYGRGAGGIVSVITQRGTNSLHGSVFGYFANDALNADNPLSVFTSTGFDKASGFAGPTNAPALPIPAGGSAAPITYNQYVATAAAQGFCTNSIAAGAVAGSHPCVNGGFGRNDRFDPASILAANNDFHQPFDSKQFGANLGGAIIKNKLFAYGSYEGTRIDNPAPIFERVPSAFDKTVSAANVGNPNYKLAQNILGLLPASNVVAVPGVLEFFQGTAPNFTNVHNVLLRADYAKSDKTNFNLRYAGQLLDQLHDDTLPASNIYPGNGADRKAQNQNVAFTFTKSYKKIINELRLGVTQFRFTEAPQDAGFDASTLGLTNKSLQTILLSGLDTRYSGAAPGVSGAFGGWWDSFWSNNGATSTPTASMQPTLDGRFPFARIGAPLDAPSLHRDTTWAVTDGLSWSRGKHSFKFGGEFRYVQNRVTDGGFSRGYIASQDIGEFTSDSESCNTGTSGGAPCNTPAFRAPSYDYALNQQPNFNALFNAPSFAGYAQDAWKLNRRITVNMGGRYEYFGVPKESNNQIWNYDPAANGLVQQGGTTVVDPFGTPCTGPVTNFLTDSIPRSISASQVGQWQCATSSNGNIIQPDLGDFAGRFGMAWDVTGNAHTVVRAGVGIFYDQTPTSYMARLLENRPTFLNTANPRYIYGQAFSFNGNNPCPQCGFGNSTVNVTSAAYNGFFQGAASPFALAGRDNRNSKAPYTRQANVTIQQQITNNVGIEVGYIGGGGHRLPITTNTGYNNEWFCTSSRVPTPGIGLLGGPPAGSTSPVCDAFAQFPIQTQADIGSSIYHSGMLRARIAQFHGLRMNATYTYSRSTDNASSANPQLVATPFLTQTFGLQEFGVGNPFAEALGSGTTILGHTFAVGKGGSGSISGADTFTSSLTTTGAGQIIVSRYNSPQDPNNFLVNDKGRSDFDTTHRLVVDSNYDLPFMKASKWWGGWTVSGILSFQSGQPFTIFAGPIFGENAQRVNASNVVLTGDPNNYITGAFTLPGLAQVSRETSGPGGVQSVVQTSCGYAIVAPPAALLQGIVGQPCTGNSLRNQFTGPNFFDTDFAVQKSFKVFGEGKELSLRSEFFNLFNRANYYNPLSVYSLDGLQQDSAGNTNVNNDFGKVKSAHSPRQIQFAARFTF